MSLVSLSLLEIISSGKPKGVMIEHKSVVNLAMAAISQYSILSSDVILQFASISFDACVEEIFSSLLSGACLVLRTDDMLNIHSFFKNCQDWSVTIADLPTAFWHQLATQLPESGVRIPSALRLIILGGERLLSGG
jgi:non-ribosomal peptide synthetase component F